MNKSANARLATYKLEKAWRDKGDLKSGSDSKSTYRRKAFETWGCDYSPHQKALIVAGRLRWTNKSAGARLAPKSLSRKT